MVHPFQVSWMRLRDINLLAINEVTNTKDKRIKAIHVPDSDRWSLRIQDTKLSDDGAYECQVTTDIQTATIVHLKVLGRPPVTLFHLLNSCLIRRDSFSLLLSNFASVCRHTHSKV